MDYWVTSVGPMVTALPSIPPLSLKSIRPIDSSETHKKSERKKKNKTHLIFSLVVHHLYLGDFSDEQISSCVLCAVSHSEQPPLF